MQTEPTLETAIDAALAEKPASAYFADVDEGAFGLDTHGWATATRGSCGEAHDAGINCSPFIVLAVGAHDEASGERSQIELLLEDEEALRLIAHLKTAVRS